MLTVPEGTTIEAGAEPPSGGTPNPASSVGEGQSLVPRACPAEAVALCEGIIDLIAVFFNVSGKELRRTGRSANPVARVRQIGMYVAHVTLGLRMIDIGTGFGRNKSTVVHACHTIEDMRDDDDFDLIVARVERLVAVAFSFESGAGRRDA